VNKEIVYILQTALTTHVNYQRRGQNVHTQNSPYCLSNIKYGKKYCRKGHLGNSYVYLESFLLFVKSQYVFSSLNFFTNCGSSGGMQLKESVLVLVNEI
jgi:hypothetical protein